MKNLIYVFSEKDRDSMVEWGYQLLKSEENGSYFIFVNDPEKHYLECSPFEFAFSDVLPL